MKVLSCNVRCYVAQDGPNDWVHRKDLCAKVIRSQHPDVICFQEMWSLQFDDLVAAFPEYRPHAVTDEPTGPHPVVGIFYRDDAYRALSAGGYWLSERPHVPGSKSWDSAYVRLTNWVRLQDRATGKEFRVVNTHLDNESQLAREKQARIIVEDAAAYPEDYPQILTGDMNCGASNKAIDVFKEAGWIDTYSGVHGAEYPGHTFHEFLGPDFTETEEKMDWIFMRGNMKAVGAEIITDSVDGRFPSDHYFVSADAIA